jgi:N-acyl homoserine lactone hydrolase
MGARALYMMDCGTGEFDYGILVAMQRPGEKVLSPFSACLIDTDDGPVLVETGIDPDGRRDPAAAAGERTRATKLSLRAEDDIRVRLKEIGLSPEEVRTVILSHMHWDHAGGCRFFPHATFVVQRAEYRFALYPDNSFSKPYVRRLFEGMSKLDLREGDGQVVPGVWVISSPGHTPGHQSVLVSLPESGKMLLAFDAIYTWENIELETVGGVPWNAGVAIDSIRRLVQLAKRENATLVPGHQPGCWSKLKRSPDCYR